MPQYTSRRYSPYLDRGYQLEAPSTSITSIGMSMHMARRDAAIAYIQSSFPPSAANTIFDSPPIDTGQVTPLPIPHIVRQEGRLTVPASTELRMRYWHLFDPELPIPDLLARCLTKGLPYHIFFLTSSSKPPHFALQPAIAPIPQARDEKLSERMVNQYFSNVQTVLSQPHAYKFLEYGGLIWRIVRHFGPEVYAKALVGPTPAAGSDRNIPIATDEIQTLLGVTTNGNSFWPYPHWYEKSSRYNGEWTAANEAWFNRHLQKINYAQAGGILAGRAWQHTIRIHTTTEVSNPTISGTMTHAQACCTHLVREWPELWDSFDLTRLA
jgi:hypothetical protein